MSEEDIQVYQYGFQCRASYRQSTKSSDIISIAYSPFSGDFALLDGAGITHWNKDTQIDKRLLTYSSNKKQLLKQIIFIPKYGIYFALAKDNTLQLLNSMLQRTFVFDADNCTILCMLYDIRKDMIITAGVGGLKMFRYLHHKCDRDQAGTDQYFIQYKHYPVRPSQWITRIQLHEANNKLLCVAQKEVILLTSDGEYLFTINTAPSLPLTDCCYCTKFKYYVTASIDSTMKVWSEQGTLLHTFTSHSKAVTSVLMHPQSDIIMISASLDKSVRLSNLETFEEIYRLQVCEWGIQWVGLTRDKFLYCGTSRDLTVWSISFIAHFYSQTRVSVSNIRPVLHCNTKKTPRVISVGEDSSVRLLSAATGQSVSTILPPPDISPLNKILDVGYSRYYGLIFLLIDRLNIWVYTSRTDPASRVDLWDEDILKLMFLATEDVSGTLGVSGSIECLTVLHSHITVDGEEGPVTPTCVNLLVLGLQDGRLVFVDPIVKGLKYHAIAVHRDPICTVREYADRMLVTTLSHVTTLTFISLPFLKIMGRVCVGSAGTVFTVLENCIVSSIETESLLQTHTLIFKADESVESKLLAEKRQDPQTAYDIHSLDGCPQQDIVVSCSGDGTLRVWTRFLIPTREIILNSTLTTACFLNTTGDLLLGFLGNIYKIAASHIVDGETARKTSIASYLTDSTVFEDPAIKYDNMGDMPPTNIDNYLMPYKGKYSTDWQGLCVTDLEEPDMETKKSGDSDQGDSMAPSDLLLSPPETVGHRSVINLSLSELSESVYYQHTENHNKEVPDAWQMPVCGVSPRTTSPAPLISPVQEEPSRHLPSSGDKAVKTIGKETDKPLISAYHLPIQRRCSHNKSDRVAFTDALSDLSLTSVSDEEKETVPEKKDKKKSAALWKPNGPSSPTTDIQKVIKKKKIEKKKARKRVALVQRRSTDRFSDKFSDITRTTTDDSGGSLVSELDQGSDSVADGKEIEEGLGAGGDGGTNEDNMLGEKKPEVLPESEVMEVTEDTSLPAKQLAKFLEKSILDTVTEGATEGIPEITEWDPKGKVRASTAKRKLGRGKSRSALSSKPSSTVISKYNSDPSHDLLKRHVTRATRVTSAPPPQQRPNSEASPSPLKHGTTVAKVTERLSTLSKSMISRRMESRVPAGKRVQSAPEVRHLTPPNLKRTKQGCPLTFTELVKAEEKSGVESKWVLQYLESDMFCKNSSPKKRIASAPPRFSHPPGSLRPPYMDKPPKPAVEPAYDEDWHEKIIERQESRRKLAEQRRVEAAERRRALDTQKQQKAALIRNRCNKTTIPRSGDYQRSTSPPPAPLPTAASLQSSYPPPPTLQTTPSLQSFPAPIPHPSLAGSSNYRVKSALSSTATTRPGSSSVGQFTRPSSSLDQSGAGGASDHTSFETMQIEPVIPDAGTSALERSPLLAKAAFLRNASQQYLYHSATATSVG